MRRGSCAHPSFLSHLKNFDVRYGVVRERKIKICVFEVFFRGTKSESNFMKDIPVNLFLWTLEKTRPGFVCSDYVT
jgi:hypothetical protein